MTRSTRLPSWDMPVEDWFTMQDARELPFDILGDGAVPTLYARLLRLLDHQGVAFRIPGTAFGTVQVSSALFSLEYFSYKTRNNTMTRHATLEDGRRILVQLDLASSQLILSEHGADEAYAYTVNQWVLGAPRRIAPAAIQVEVMLDVTPGITTPGPVFVRLDWVEQYIFNPLRDGRGLSLNHIARLTGVPASTLSRVKNQPDSLHNLPVSTLLPLSLLGQQLAFEHDIAVSWSVYAVTPDATYTLVVTTTSQVYRVTSENRLYIEQLHVNVLDALSSGATAVTLSDAVDGVMDGDVRHDSVTLRTEHIISVVLGQTKQAVEGEVRG